MLRKWLLGGKSVGGNIYKAYVYNMDLKLMMCMYPLDSGTIFIEDNG